MMVKITIKRRQVKTYKLVIILVILVVCLWEATASNKSFTDKSFANTKSFSQGVMINYLMPINVEISSEGINRISLPGNRIAKIIGDSSSFNGLVSDNGDDLFLVSKLAAGKIINLTIATVEGKNIDLKCIVLAKKEPVYAVVRMESVLSGKQAVKKEEISKMIEAMSCGDEGKYHIDHLDRALRLVTRTGEQMRLKEELGYRFGNLVGIKMSCLNLDKDKAVLDVKELIRLNFSDIVAIAVDNEILQPGTSSAAYIVTEVEDEANR